MHSRFAFSVILGSIVGSLGYSTRRLVDPTASNERHAGARARIHVRHRGRTFPGRPGVPTIPLPSGLFPFPSRALDASPCQSLSPSWPPSPTQVSVATTRRAALGSSSGSLVASAPGAGLSRRRGRAVGSAASELLWGSGRVGFTPSPCLVILTVWT
ncbi:hypothetical protein GUJ93_ZPchr0001g33088 [Zizania palustris]|uniref:Uncharacterized protein n=1 Tax=Zizania palustris TaxID=103762 RepID=A0A8J5SEI1_ZIZPA|nr:hypothetical protein GUJ93_ZPchr0001g33088 [Zizania palustris]